jgi:hypothetical protein
VGPRAGLDDMEGENSSPYCDLDTDPLVDQAVGSYYADCATVALCMYQYKAKIQTEKECKPQAS